MGKNPSHFSCVRVGGPRCMVSGLDTDPSFPWKWYHGTMPRSSVCRLSNLPKKRAAGRWYRVAELRHSGNMRAV